MANRLQPLVSMACGVVVMAMVGCANIARDVETVPDPAVASPPVPPPPAAVAGVTHIVEAGQTLFAIARAYGIEVRELAAANRLADPDRLEVGQRLFIPGATATLAVGAPAVPETGWLWPIEGGTVLSHFGAPRGRRRHKGLDIGGRHGQAIVAVEAGEVIYSGATMRGYGKTVIIDHGDGLKSLYAHNSRLLVAEGQRVKRGQVIARVGRSGNASGDHCHFEVRQDDIPRDPLRFIARGPGSAR